MESNKFRLEFLDGLRGLSALLVLLFHTFSWNNETLGFSQKLGDIFFLKSGWLGAEVFFMISGFVIMMTLEKSIDMWTFLKKRFLRMYPALFVSCILLLLTYILLGQGRVGEYFPDYNIFDILSSFTLTDTYFWNIGLRLLNINIFVNGINASFWTLFVEVKFYILFGTAYFLFGQRKSVLLLFVWSIVSLSVDIFWIPAGLLRVFWASISGLYFGWFSIGVAMYFYFKNKDKSMLYIAIGMAILSIAYLSRIRGELVFSDYYLALALSALFIVGVLYKPIQKLLSVKWLLFLGFISYPLYLLHEPFLVSSIYLTNLYLPWIPKELSSLILITFISFISWIIAKYIEPTLIQTLKKYLNLKDGNK